MSMIGTFRSATDAEIERLLADPKSIEAFIYEADDADGGDLHIDKTWHGLHFLLTGTDWAGDPPLNFLVSGGTRVGDVEVGYDVARAFTSAQVREIAGALSGLSVDELRQRFDPERMDELDIYPHIWTRPPEEDDSLGYLIEYFEILERYVSTLARDGLGMLVYIT
jgi:hypothetical protein